MAGSDSALNGCLWSQALTALRRRDGSIKTAMWAELEATAQLLLSPILPLQSCTSSPSYLPALDPLAHFVTEQISPMDPASPLPAELAAEEATAFSLVDNSSGPFSASQRREIFVSRQASGDGGDVLAITEKSSSGGNTDTERKYVMDADFAIPLHATSGQNRPAWTVRVGYVQGSVWTDYPFRSSEGAFRFQQLMTGYKVVGVYTDITCLATYKGGLTLRRPQYAGLGSAQIWWDVDKTSQAQAGHLSMVSSRSSNSSQSSGRPTSIASIQSTSTLVQKYDGQPVLVVQKPRPPLLVAFLKDKGSGEAYAALKADSKSLWPSITPEIHTH
ncbi:hypothetical protein B0T16DRAFT_104721 [Cercophora newfieldiana]|uniref:Uncharacterized protein n=1 Tax=Cercophora newfieldiana TaxID=92897 RepID=A0AA39YHI3_9PEZI|nr:hypothetical protein B0T16DRAFT_104721 [Cercophora newfieldiana]